MIFKIVKETILYKEMLYALVNRDINVRYKQTVLGIIWFIIKPIVSMIAMTVVFGKLAQMPSGDIPYPLITLSGIALWQFFSTAVSDSSSSLVANQNLITKIYFPRVVLVLFPILVSAVDFFITFILFLILAIIYNFIPDLKIILFPIFFILLILLVFGISLFLATINLLYRDVKIVIPFALQLGLYISPVGYLSSVVPEKYQYLYYINPLVGLIDAMRWCLFKSFEFNFISIGISILWILFLTYYGISFFNKFERKFADYI
jgi:lipopolysaccharide transport system permease protein